MENKFNIVNLRKVRELMRFSDGALVGIYIGAVNSHDPDTCDIASACSFLMRQRFIDSVLYCPEGGDDVGNCNDD